MTGEVAAIIFTFTFLFLILVAYPIALGSIMIKSDDELRERALFRKWEPLLEGIRIQSTMARAYNLFFILRRIFFVCIIFLLDSSPIYQMISLQFLHLYMIYY
jgi:hypothetical protein